MPIIITKPNGEKETWFSLKEMKNRLAFKCIQSVYNAIKSGKLETRKLNNKETLVKEKK